MKILRIIVCTGMVLFLLFSPAYLVKRAQESYTDPRFVRKEPAYTGSIVLYHIVRHRPYTGSLTQWLRDRAKIYEKKHKGVFIEIEGIDEDALYERIENGRIPDAYSFFSGSLYPDRLQTIPDLTVPLKPGLKQADRAVPYCYSGYCRLVRTPESADGKAYYCDDILAARLHAGQNDAAEDRADVLYLDFRLAGDLIRYKEGFALAATEPIDEFTDAVCWIGIDRETDADKANAILGFIAFLSEQESQQSLNALGLMSVRNDVKSTPPDASLKQIFRVYENVRTVDPFRWQAEYDALHADAVLARAGDGEAQNRFINRLQELYR